MINRRSLLLLALLAFALAGLLFLVLMRSL